MVLKSAQLLKNSLLRVHYKVYFRELKKRARVLASKTVVNTVFAREKETFRCKLLLIYFYKLKRGTLVLFLEGI